MQKSSYSCGHNTLSNILVPFISRACPMDLFVINVFGQFSIVNWVTWQLTIIYPVRTASDVCLLWGASGLAYLESIISVFGQYGLACRGRIVPFSSRFLLPCTWSPAILRRSFVQAPVPPKHIFLRHFFGWWPCSLVGSRSAGEVST